MNLKCTEKVVYEVDYKDLEEFIKSHYGHNFDLIYDQDASNDSTITEYVCKEFLETWERKELETYKETGKGCYLLQTLLTDLCENNILEEGEYLIKISW